MLTRRKVLTLGGLAAFCLMLFGHRGLTMAWAAPGWRWTEDGSFELTGVVTAVDSDAQHIVLTVDADGEPWTAELRRPPTGLQSARLAAGRRVTLSGARSALPGERRMQAERILL